MSARPVPRSPSHSSCVSFESRNGMKARGCMPVTAPPLLALSDASTWMDGWPEVKRLLLMLPPMAPS